MPTVQTAATTRAPLRAAAALLVGLWVVPGLATTVMQMNLADMCARAERIFRGRVLEIRSGEVEVGGGRLPTITYVLEVEEAFKGSFESIKGMRLAQVTMLGKIPPAEAGSLRRVDPLSGLPVLTLGETYLLLTSTPGPSGMSTTIGLGQGCFRLDRLEGGEVVTNGFDNRGLFAGLTALAPDGPGPLSYERLAGALRALLPADGEEP